MRFRILGRFIWWGGLLWAVIVGAGGSATATEYGATVDGVVAAIEGKYATVETLRARFVQTTRAPNSGEDRQAGVVILRRPSKLRWDYGNSEKMFISNGRTLWVYTRADNQVIVYDDVDTNGSGLDHLLTSLAGIREMFDVRMPGGSSGQIVLDLTPKSQGQSTMSRVVLSSDLLLQTVVMTDPAGAVTELTLSDVELNTPVRDTDFEFRFPEGAEVIIAGSP